MSVTYGFYNSLNGDRKYDTSQMSKIFDGIINDGIYIAIGDKFAVSASSGMTILVGTGRAWFDHTWTLNDALLPITLTDSNVVMDRIDAIVLETDSTESVRVNSIKYIQGTASSTPANPVLTNTDLVHQYPLAYIYVTKGATTISQANIINKVGTTDCPYVTGILENTNIDNLVAQWQDLFNTWFNKMKGQLSTDAAGNLQNEIDTHTGNSTIHMNTSEKSALNSAVQAIKFAGASASKTGTEVDIPFGPFNINDVVSVPYTDADNENLFTPGYYDCANVISSNPFGSNPSGGITQYMLLVTIANHGQDMGRNIFQMAIRKSDGCVKIRSIGPDDFSEGWFPQNDDGTGLKHYTKYADGRLHEWGFQVGNITVTSAYGNMFLYSHYNFNLLNHCVSNVSAHVNILSTGGHLVGEGATVKYGTDNVLEFSVLSPTSVTNIKATFMYDLWSRWKL